MNITCILALVAFIIAILSALGKAPLWIAVLFLSIALLLGCFPR